MRSREVIEKDMNGFIESCVKDGTNPSYDDVIVELLLDIRDILTKNKGSRERFPTSDSPSCKIKRGDL